MLGLALVNAGVDYGDDVGGGIQQGDAEGIQVVENEEGEEQVEESEEVEIAEEPDHVESDAFHDARATPSAVSVTSSASGNRRASGGPNISGRTTMGSGEHGYTAGGVSDDGASDGDAVPDVEAGVRRSKRGRAATTTEPAPPLGPAPIKKRLRSGRNL